MCKYLETRRTLAQRKPSRAVQHIIANRVTGKMTERERESQRARWTEKERFCCSEGHREAQKGVVCIP